MDYNKEFDEVKGLIKRLDDVRLGIRVLETEALNIHNRLMELQVEVNADGSEVNMKVTF